MNLCIASIDRSTEGVANFELRALNDGQLPAFAPGAYVEMRLPGGITRSYSLANSAVERHRYVIAVQRELPGRGGSAWLHHTAAVGMSICVSGPANHFELNEDADRSILIAGGIGITPLWSMIQRLDGLGKDWTLHYRARSRSSASFLNELMRPEFEGRTRLSFSDEPSTRLDIGAVVSSSPPGAHLYCCGPSGMLDNFQDACAGRNPAHVHLERFGSDQRPSQDGGFEVVLQRSSSVVQIRPGQTILTALQASGVAVPSSCQQGVCGACETTVIEGTPDHRDMVLSEAERAAGTTMMICCSGSRTPQLVLDL